MTQSPRLSRLLGCFVGLTSALLVGCGDSKDGPGSDSNPLVSGLSIKEVAIYQGVKASVMKDNASATPAVPVVAGRPGLLRVYFAPPVTWVSRPVIVHLELSQKGMPLPAMEQQLTVVSSQETTLESTANFDLPAATLTPDLTWSVTLREIDNKRPVGDTSGARYPAMGEVPLGAITTGKVKITILPIQYAADGSNRMPATDAKTLEKFRTHMLAMYPVTDVELTVANPLSWSSKVNADGSGWDELLNAVLTKRYRDGAPADTYYYGLFVPSSSFPQYCNRGCVLGLSPLAYDPADDTARASIGLGYQDAYSDPQETFVHEVGHAHGREHAPCDVQDPDPAYPYDDGKIGSWGYDSIAKKFFDPNGKTRDMMGYCQPDWISDYTFSALAQRVQSVNLAPRRLVVPTRWRNILVKGDGSLVRGEIVTAQRPPIGQTKLVERVDGDQAVPVESHFYPFDHLPGGILMIPDTEDVGTLRIDGQLLK